MKICEEDLKKLTSFELKKKYMEISDNIMELKKIKNECIGLFNSANEKLKTERKNIELIENEYSNRI